MLGTIVGILLALVGAAVVIYIVGKLDLGLSLDGFMPAIIAAVVIAVVGGIITGLLGVLGIHFPGGLIGAMVNATVTAVVLLIGSRYIKGMEVYGFFGALVAAIAIGVITWFANWVLGVLNLA